MSKLTIKKIKSLFIWSSVFLIFFSALSGTFSMESEKNSDSALYFQKIIEKAKDKKWKNLPIGELIAKVALELKGMPYIAGTLEGDKEVCRIDLCSLDCVTLFENSLGMARIIKKGYNQYDKLYEEVEFTRYRDGKLTDYTSRLHYTSDWIFDNIRKNVVVDMSKELGGVNFPINVYFMSKNPDKYDALKNHPEYVSVIAETEKDINSRTYYYIPNKKIKTAQEKIKTGDIIAIVTKIKGLDYSHTGLAYRDENGVLRFLHASLKKKEVILDKELYKYVMSRKSNIGISVLRPLEIKIDGKNENTD